MGDEKEGGFVFRFKNLSAFLILISIAMASLGCIEEPQSWQSSSYSSPLDRKKFKDALTAAGIPHEIYMDEEGKEFVKWKKEHSEAVQGIKDSLFGKRPPSGRSISFEGKNIEFMKWLENNHIPFRLMTHRGKEYVVWEQRDNSKVAAYPFFPSIFWEKKKEPPIASEKEVFND